LKGVKPKAQFTLQVDSLKIPEINWKILFFTLFFK
jgi:hypothetical protein